MNRFQISKFTKNIATIMSGSLIAQTIVFLLTPILTRIFSPSEFGMVASFSAIQIILSIAATLYYHQAIMIDKEDSRSKGTVYVALYSTTFVSLFVAICAFLYVLVFDYNTLTIAFLIMLPIETFFIGIKDISNVWNNRNKKYKAISLTLVIYSFTQSSVSIILGLLGIGPIALLIGKFVAIFLQAVILFYVMIKKTKFLEIEITKNIIIEQFSKHKRYPIYNLPSQLLNTSSVQFPIMLFSNYYGDFRTGSYSKASNLTQLPLSLVGGSVGTVYFQSASKIYNEGDYEHLRKFTLSTFRKLLFLSIIPLIILNGFGDILFSFVLGDEWMIAGHYASILSPWYMFTFITSPMSTILYIKEKHKQNALINILLLISRVGTVLICILVNLEFINTLIILSIVGSFVWIFLNSYFLKLSGVKFRNSFVPAIVVILFSIIIAQMLRSLVVI